MRAGSLRLVVLIEQPTETVAASGAITTTWSTFATVRASIEPISAREFERAKGIAASVSHKISLWYIDGVTPRMRINWSGRIFSINGVINQGETCDEYALYCTENLA